MKHNLLGGTALIGAAAVIGGAVLAAEAPTWKLSGNMNFQFYWVEQDFNFIALQQSGPYPGLGIPYTFIWVGSDPAETDIQDHGWYFGVDEAELRLDVSGTADNGLNYGFKIEINTNTSDTEMADEARIELSGSWGTLHLGDEDGAEDTMNYGGENLMGATGGFDGDFDDVLLRNVFVLTGHNIMDAPSYPTIAGDTGDSTKVTYYSPRFSGFQLGVSITPQPKLGGDDFKSDSGWENHYGLGANYDNTFGNLRLRASAVYSAASANFTRINDVSAWSVGGIVGWGAFSLGANYTDNGDSGIQTNGPFLTFSAENSYWNVAAGFETGPLYLSAGYFSATHDFTAGTLINSPDSTFENIALTADYTAAPGLGFYAEIDLISSERQGNDPSTCIIAGVQYCANDATVFIMGANVSF